ncbi:TrlF family AAA-like ATPase [Vibrio crassostreae]|uniref:TrlF family AAA-like ATPase n=1 Tax=Vibrio crassostreae TaxID=246167 RepID=UPI000F4F0046|nr:hypothetical protein [Vibrio crassostreae]RPF10073.1 hypothetical protein EDB14_1148 [Vibrio crassostreae]TCW19250.1 hypothetical protein EDB48_106368 [Vibrio crassostreae]
MNNSRGSQWRKWDLHVHTPDSILNSQFDGDWDQYVVTLFKAAIKEGIHAVGITDYYLPTGYIKLRTEYLENPSKMSELFSVQEIDYINKMLVVANIEFRLDTTVIKERELKYNRKVNYHVIISDEVPCEVLMEEFIQKVTFPFDVQVGAVHETRTLNTRNLIEYGQLIKKNQGFQDPDLYVGVMCASVNVNQIISVLNNHSDLKNNYMLGLPADEDLSEISWNSSGYSNRKDLIVKSHFIFSSNEKTQKFLHGEYSASHLEEFGSFKACLWGSDAHDFDKLFKPDCDRHTWIKSDVTFKGLYQVIHEPKTRAHIGPHSPDIKLDYQVIDNIKLVSADTYLFPKKSIKLNPYLNSVIGGKSSGKSMLLYHMAKAINSSLVDERTYMLGEKIPYSFDGLDVEITWRDGSVSKLSEPDDSRPITYIPQLYINRLSESSAQLEFNNLVLDILNQDSNFQSFNDKKTAQIKSKVRNIEVTLHELSSHRIRLKNTRDELNKLGSADLIRAEIVRLKKESERIQKASNFTPEEQVFFRQYSKRLNIVSSRYAIVTQYYSELDERLLNLDEAKDSIIKSPIESFFHGLMPEPSFSEKKDIEPILTKHFTRAWDEINSLFTTRKERVDSIMTSLEIRIKDYESELKPFIGRVKDAELIKVLIEQIKIQQSKLDSILNLRTLNKEITHSGQHFSELLRIHLLDLVSNYKSYQDELAKEQYTFDNGLNIKASVDFDHDGFDQFVSCFDRRKNMAELLGSLSEASVGYNFHIDTYVDDIWHIYKNCIKEDTKANIKTSANLDKILSLLFKNWLRISYDVSYKNDDIIRMSPGKRGLVLLNMILQMSNSCDPVLIDQPEDNLDNRTIYDQLRDFIIQNKIKRQIIMVTHNANLVVSTDSECIIVANQNGQDDSNVCQKTRFDYRGGSLENSYELSLDKPILESMGIREHVCQLLEGGELAFKERERKYGFA